MIERMTKYSFILLKEQNEQFLRTVSEAGVIDIKRSEKAIDDKSAALFDEIDSISKRVALLKKSDFKSDPEYASLLSSLNEAETVLNNREIWGDIDFDKVNSLSKNGIELSFFCVPNKRFDPSWVEDYGAATTAVKDGKVYFAIAHTSGQALPEGITPLAMPQGVIAELQGRVSDIKVQIGERAAALEAEKETIPAMLERKQELLSQLDLYLADSTGESAVDGHLTVYVGFAPKREDETVRTRLEESGLFYMAEDATKDDNPPILLHNNAFARQFEPLTGMYGMPVYDEFDPTPILAPFFLLFFAMCMGDAGYGLLLIAISLVLRKMKGGLAELWRLVLLLGTGTFFIGILLGTFFGISLPDAAWVPQKLKDIMITGEIAGYNAQMVLAIAIGIVHICIAMVIKGICFTKRFGFKDTISTWGWVTLIVGGLIVAGFSIGGVISAPVTKITVIIIGIISALGIFIFNKPGRNPLLNIGAGLWDTYGMVTGLAGDILSYIRLFALGLAGGMLGSAFNTLASMTLGSSPTWQWLPFVLILLIGHALNLAMACLGAFVHPLRLNFLEFFKNSGYEGRGIKYNPIINNN